MSKKDIFACCVLSLICEYSNNSILLVGASNTRVIAIRRAGLVHEESIQTQELSARRVFGRARDTKAL